MQDMILRGFFMSLAICSFMGFVACLAHRDTVWRDAPAPALIAETAPLKSSSGGADYVAQKLIEAAWQKSLSGTREHVRPWPWLESWPVARLSIPAMGADMVVMRGVNPSVLVHAPGWHDGSSAPGTPGISVVSAYRDRHFSFLKNMKSGMSLSLLTADGERKNYVVSEVSLTEDREIRVPVPRGQENVLVLSTSYPVGGDKASKRAGRTHIVVVAREAVPAASGGNAPELIL
jgi:sortase A